MRKGILQLFSLIKRQQTMVNVEKLMLKLIYISAFFRQEAGGINLSNIRQSGRVRKTVDYTFSEFDQEILEAVDRDGRKRRTDESSQSITTTRGIRQSKRRRILYNDSDCDSNYDPGSPVVEPQMPKHPERHVYLRRHENGLKNGNSNTEKDKQEDVLSGKTDDRSASDNTALQNNEAVYDGNSFENSKLSNSAIVGASSNRYGESGSLRDAVIMDTVNETRNSSLVQNNRLSTDVIQTTDTTSQSQEDMNKDSVNTTTSQRQKHMNKDSVNETTSQSQNDMNKDLVNTTTSQSQEDMNKDSGNAITNQSQKDMKKDSGNTDIQANDSTNIRLLNKQDAISLNLSEDSVIQLNDNTQVHTSTTDEMSRDRNVVNGNECTRVESNCGLLNSRDINLLKQESEQPDLTQKNYDNLHESTTFA